MEYCTLPIAIILIVLSILGVRRVPEQFLRMVRETAANTCLVQTNQTGITIHVGPGYNRGIRDYLPPDQPFTVIGQATADDGSLWWQIAIEGVDQAWVAASEVDDLGACEAVTDTDAPPIVPAAPPAPTGNVVSFPVYNCVYLGSGEFEWVSADVTYDDAGTVVEEAITGGPFRGQWQPTCPAGDQPSGGGDSNPAPPPDNTSDTSDTSDTAGNADISDLSDF